VAPGGGRRGRDADRALFAAGIGCSALHLAALPPVLARAHGLREGFPHSQRAYERMLSLPLYTRMTNADVGRVAASLRRALKA
jgi:dTDP-4-amino-4,6-dideoxygalactose transaminase